MISKRSQKPEKGTRHRTESDLATRPASAMADTIHSDLVRVLVIGHLALLMATWPLWIPQAWFPQVPLISIAGTVPVSVEWGLFVLLLASLVGQLLFPSPTTVRRLSLLAAFASFLLVCIDQHRLQPWTWQFIVLSVVVATAEDATARNGWRWLVISIYVWSAWSKWDHGFFVGHGRFLIDGFCKASRFISDTQAWPAPVLSITTIAIPMFELLIGLGLIWRRTRGLALVGSFIMHFMLLLALGPFGHGHKPGVLIWNLFFIAQNFLLFHPQPDSLPPASRHPATRSTRNGNRLARFAVIAAIVWPSVESFGFCDHWPAWAVYAARPERVSVYIHAAELSKHQHDTRFDLLKHSPGPQVAFDDWHTLRIDRWSLDALYVPIYPQARFQVGVAIDLARTFQFEQIRVVIEGPANRWTGKRSLREFSGSEALNRLARTFRFNAFPRRHQTVERSSPRN